MSRPRFGLRLPLCARPDDVVREAVRLERLGWEIAWIPDGQLDMYECWVNLAAIKLATNRLELGLCVTNPLTRHPSVTACAAATLDQLRDGRRLLLGIGVGDSCVRPMGVPVATRGQLRDAIAFIRELQGGGFVQRNGKEFHMTAADGRLSPIYVAATGPKMLQLAGEVADGVVSLAGVSPEALAYVQENVELGAKRAHRRLDDVEIVIGSWSCVSDDPELCIEQARPICAHLMMEGQPAVERAGLRPPSHIEMSGLYPDVIHAENWEMAVEKSRKWLPRELLEEFVDRFLIVGSADVVRQKVGRLVDQGIRTFYIRGYGTYEFATDLATAYSEHVFPYLAHPAGEFDAG